MRLDRTGILIRPDCSRVLLRAFDPQPKDRVLRILKRIMSIDEDDVDLQLEVTLREFDGSHHNLRGFLLARYAHVRRLLREYEVGLSENRKLLIGAYFTSEYALECAALFNPSLVWHPDQSGLEVGTRRFIMSLRATGEGHISSICFRTGTITAANEIRMEAPGRCVAVGEVVPDPIYDRHLFVRKLREIGISSVFVDEVFGDVGEKFTMPDLEERLATVSRQYRSVVARTRAFSRARDHIMSLAYSNYEVTFSADLPVSERVLFPTAPAERNGIEDARFVRFTDDSSVRYYATYTAYNGLTTVPQLIETEDFLRFKISTLNGSEVRNKGMALFPRKVNGQFAMLSRQDNENIYVMLSDHAHFWTSKEKILAPRDPWNFIQLGNCGSPIETERGWLVISHGVGPMRTYSISAFLLDLDDPRVVTARLHEPLLVAEGEERVGYVPNVVYSCGSLVNNGSLILPYAVSDHATTIAVVNLDELLDSMW